MLRNVEKKTDTKNLTRAMKKSTIYQDMKNTNTLNL